MKIYLADQSEKLVQQLAYLKRQPVMQYGRERLIEKVTVAPVNTTKSLPELNTGFLFDYRIFPESIMSFLAQWNHEKREMQVGDTIVQQVFIPPFRRFSQKIIFGVRIKEIINAPDRIGFSYETLKGHAEKGISTFTIETTADRKIVFNVHTFSAPGSFLTKLAAPVSIPYQAYCTRKALLNVKGQLEGRCGFPG